MEFDLNVWCPECEGPVQGIDMSEYVEGGCQYYIICPTHGSVPTWFDPDDYYIGDE